MHSLTEGIGNSVVDVRIKIEINVNYRDEGRRRARARTRKICDASRETTIDLDDARQGESSLEVIFFHRLESSKQEGISRASYSRDRNYALIANNLLSQVAREATFRDVSRLPAGADR